MMTGEIFNSAGRNFSKPAVRVNKTSIARVVILSIREVKLIAEQSRVSCSNSDAPFRFKETLLNCQTDATLWPSIPVTS